MRRLAIRERNQRIFRLANLRTASVTE